MTSKETFISGAMTFEPTWIECKTMATDYSNPESVDATKQERPYEYDDLYSMSTAIGIRNRALEVASAILRCQGDVGALLDAAKRIETYLRSDKAEEQ